MDFDTKNEKLDALLRHIEEVKKNCLLLATRLMDKDKNNFEFAKKLIANSFLHDNSKFSAIEFQHLTKADEDDEMLKVVIEEHEDRNFHHPEHWGCIKEMPKIYLAECVSDWRARSSELGTDLKDWINTTATKKWEFTKRDKVYKQIMEYVNLLLEQSL